jgi:hypothetical protein
VYRVENLTLVKWGLPEFCDFGAFSKPPAELHFKMQVIHIDDVLGGRHESFGPEQTIEELNMAAKKKAKKAKKATKKKAAKKKK